MTRPLKENVRFVLYLTDDEMINLAFILDTVLRNNGLSMARIVSPIIAECDAAQVATEAAEAELRAAIKERDGDDGEAKPAAKLH